ncbi:hypothetical protein EAI_01746 [Harpegnathos saltator]|uniref:Uncharacterized protein n=1 Tax=Harpegnathos saltator TaxID=610380 RepID=E2C8A4_HARSA|nr:hypothetical protein EAI_01746 [Harpegnathos saltator]
MAKDVSGLGTENRRVDGDIVPVLPTIIKRWTSSGVPRGPLDASSGSTEVHTGGSSGAGPLRFIVHREVELRGQHADNNSSGDKKTKAEKYTDARTEKEKLRTPGHHRIGKRLKEKETKRREEEKRIELLEWEVEDHLGSGLFQTENDDRPAKVVFQDLATRALLKGVGSAELISEVGRALGAVRLVTRRSKTLKGTFVALVYRALATTEVILSTLIARIAAQEGGKGAATENGRKMGELREKLRELRAENRRLQEELAARETAACSAADLPLRWRPHLSGVGHIRRPLGAALPPWRPWQRYQRGPKWHRIKLADMGIPGSLKFRQALTGAMLIKVSGSNSGADAERLVEEIRRLAAEKGPDYRVQRPDELTQAEVRMAQICVDLNLSPNAQDLNIRVLNI